MNMTNKALKHIYRKMAMMNYYDTFGTIIMKNGMAFRITKLFEYFRESWNDYRLAKMAGDTEKIKEILAETGGIVSNGEIDLDLDEIAAAVSDYKMIKGISKDFVSFDGIEEMLESIDGEEFGGDSN